MRAFGLIALLILGSALPGGAQQKLFRYRTVEHNGVAVEGRTYDVVVAENRARIDRPRDHLILDESAGKAYLVDHALKENFVFELPVRRLELLNEKTAEAYRKIADHLTVEILETSAAAEVTTIAGYECRDHFVHLSMLGGQHEELLTVCLTVDPIPEAALYWRLSEVEGEVTPGREEVLRHFAKIGGFPMRWRSDTREERGRITQTRVVEEIEVSLLDEATFSPHPDYKETLPDPEGRFLSRPRPYPGS